MASIKYFYTSLFLVCITTVFSQTDIIAPEKKFGFEITAKFGNGKLDIKDAVDFNGTYSAGDFLFVYRLGKAGILKSGVTLAEFNTNFTTLGESGSLKNSYLQIPLKYYFVTPLSNGAAGNTKIDFQFGLGVAANNLYKSEIELTTLSTTEKNIDWNFGAIFELGLDFSFAKYANFGIYYEAQSDLNRLNNNDSEQKLTGVNMVKFAYIINF